MFPSFSHNNLGNSEKKSSSANFSSNWYDNLAFDHSENDDVNLKENIEKQNPQKKFKADQFEADQNNEKSHAK